MGVDALLVLDEVHDVEKLIGALTVGDAAVLHQQVVDSLKDTVQEVRPHSYYGPRTHKADRVIVDMFTRYWYPGESHHSPYDWSAVSAVCKMLWDIEATIVVHYLPDALDDIGDVTAHQVIEHAHLLTPARVSELDEEAARAATSD